MAVNILLVEDEPAIQQMVAMALRKAGYDVAMASDASEAQTRIVGQLPDLMLLDWMLPGISGVEYARQLKKSELTREVPIIMLTARGEESDKIRGFDSGADDYVTKPFSPRELVARINAVLRRASPHVAAEVIEVGGLRLDAAGHRVTVQDEVLPMGPTEYRLLHFFMTHPERVYTRGQLLDRVWGGDVYVEERTVDVHVGRLRKAINRGREKDPIRTVRGSGYAFGDRKN